MADLAEVSLESLTRDHFEQELGTTFEIPFDDGSIYGLELVETRDVFAGGNREGKRQAFAIAFLGASSRYPKQGTYPLQHPELGRLSLFIVPLGPDPKNTSRMRFEAIFT